MHKEQQLKLENGIKLRIYLRDEISVKIICSKLKVSSKQNIKKFNYKKIVDIIINFVYRNSINCVRQYDLANTILGDIFLNAINIIEIKHDDVDLS